MPVILKLTFPAGRYHATPWGRHVNEGVAEWPPSPWRLLRALVAVWKRTCPRASGNPGPPHPEALAQPPRFQLPPHRVAHTRHYMPWEKKGPDDRTLVFDTFVCVGRGDPTVSSDGRRRLSTTQRSSSQLLGNLSSLGRAESWVRAELSRIESMRTWNLAPLNERPQPRPRALRRPGHRVRRRTLPDPRPEETGQGEGEPVRLPVRLPALASLPGHRNHRESEMVDSVPGTKWVDYTRPCEVSTMSTRPKPSDGPKPTVARFLLDGPVLPLVNDTIRVAEAMRRGLIRRYQRALPSSDSGHTGKPDQELFRSEVLSGKNADGRFLREHRHAFYLPTAEGSDPRQITHVTVSAADGFGPDEVAALNALRTLKLDEESSGAARAARRARRQAGLPAPLLEESRVWVSATPFLVTRHMKRNGVKRDPREFFEAPDGGTSLSGRSSARSLNDEGSFGGDDDDRLDYVGTGTAFDRFSIVCIVARPAMTAGLGFAGSSVCGSRSRSPGPIALGHSCHFGLGLFVAAEGLETT